MQPAISNYFTSTPRIPKPAGSEPETAPIPTQQPAATSAGSHRTTRSRQAQSLTKGAYDGIDWTRLRGFTKPPLSETGRPTRSRIWDYGWRIHSPKVGEDGTDYWLCKICHLRSPRTQRPTIHMLVAGSSTLSKIAHLYNTHEIEINGKRVVGPPAPAPSKRTDEIIEARKHEGSWDPDTFLHLLLQWFVLAKVPWEKMDSKLFHKLLITSNPQCGPYIPTGERLEELYGLYGLEPFSGEA